MRRTEKRRRREKRRRKQVNASRTSTPEHLLRAEAVTDPDARAELARRGAG